jgi:CDP-2,3-bis-(O-geranylgeranyl)-sn-glycerol synthase
MMYQPIFFLLSFWYVLPAYVANGFAVFAKLCKARHPIDGDRVLRDGRPLFGAGKTWEGFLIGFLSGTIIGLLQLFTSPFLHSIIIQYLILPPELGPIVYISILQVPLIALGALVGDLLGSFIKRRLNISPGRPAPFLDQLDFLGVAILFGIFVNPLPILFIIFLFIVTPIIHFLANVIGYLLRLKEVPW